jgi:hypothetical protein
MDRVAPAGEQFVNALTGQAEAVEPLRSALALVREHPGTDTVSARRRIGDLAIAHCRYPF